MNRNIEVLKKITNEVKGLYSLSRDAKQNIARAYGYEEYSDLWKANKEAEYINTYHNNAYRVIDNVNALISDIDFLASDNSLSNNEDLRNYLSLLNSIGSYNDNNIDSYNIIESEILSSQKGNFKALQLLEDKLSSNGYTPSKIKNSDIKTAMHYLAELETHLPDINKSPKSNIIAFHRIEKSISKLADVLGSNDDYSVIPSEDSGEVQEAIIGSAIGL